MSRSRASTSTDQSIHQPNNQSTNQPSKPPGQLWLLKLPNYLADHIKKGSINQPTNQSINQPLAQLDVSTLPDGSQQIRLMYQPIDPNLPKEFLLKPRAKRAMLVFQDPVRSINQSTNPSMKTSTNQSTNQSELPCKLVGPVSFIADATPVDNAAYRAFLTARSKTNQSTSQSTNQSINQPVKRTMKFDDPDDMVNTPAVMAELERQNRKKRQKKAEEENPSINQRDKRPQKRYRAEREEVEAMLLRAFDSQKFLTFKQLEDITNQPKPYLQKVLGEMCVRETMGEQKDKYTLNERYRID